LLPLWLILFQLLLLAGAGVDGDMLVLVAQETMGLVAAAALCDTQTTFP
jgi:hypothetical protein